MRISVIVPVYNEERTVTQVLEALATVPLDLEVVVIDDASTDRTWEILRQRAPFSSCRYLRHETNQGKGVGLSTGFSLTSGELVTVQDADLEYAMLLRRRFGTQFRVPQYTESQVGPMPRTSA